MSETTVTREQAEVILAAVKAAFTGQETTPELIENWTDGHAATPWAIVWEKGPHDWALHFGMGGFNEELYEAAMAEFGGSIDGCEYAMQLAEEEPFADPDGTFTAPVTTKTLGIYPGCVGCTHR